MKCLVVYHNGSEDFFSDQLYVSKYIYRYLRITLIRYGKRLHPDMILRQVHAYYWDERSYYLALKLF